MGKNKKVKGTFNIVPSCIFDIRKCGILKPGENFIESDNEDVATYEDIMERIRCLKKQIIEKIENGEIDK
jgi:hypothetical protein